MSKSHISHLKYHGTFILAPQVTQGTTVPHCACFHTQYIVFRLHQFKLFICKILRGFVAHQYVFLQITPPLCLLTIFLRCSQEYHVGRYPLVLQKKKEKKQSKRRCVIEHCGKSRLNPE